MKNQKQLQKEFEALIELMLETGIALQNKMVGNQFIGGQRHLHTRYSINADMKTVQLLSPLAVSDDLSNVVKQNKHLYKRNNLLTYDLVFTNNGKIDARNLEDIKNMVERQIDEANRNCFGVCAYHQARRAINRISGAVQSNVCDTILAVMKKIKESDTTPEDIKDLNNALKTIKKSAAANKNKALKMQFQLLFTHIKIFFTFVGLKIRHRDVKLKEMIKDKTQLDKNIIAENKTDAAFKLAACSSVGLFRKTHKKCVDNYVKNAKAVKKQREKKEVSRYEESAHQRAGLARMFGYT